MEPRATTRRAFLRFMASSPLFASLDLSGCTEAGTPAKAAVPPAPGTADPTAGLISSADEALDVFDFRAGAQQRLPPAHWGYMATGVDG